MASLAQDMAAYDAMKAELEQNHLGQWVLIHDEGLVGTYDTFHAAAEVALAKFGAGPYHIRKVGDEEAQPYPASLRFRPV